MNLRSLTLLMCFVFILMQIILSSIGSSLFMRQKEEAKYAEERSYINKIFALHAESLAANLYLGHDSIIDAKMAEIAKAEGVFLQIDQIGGKRKFGNIDSDLHLVKEHFDLELAGDVLGRLTIARLSPPTAMNERYLLFLLSALPVLFLAIALVSIYRWIVKLIVDPILTTVKVAQGVETLESSQSRWIPEEILTLNKSIRRLVEEAKEKSRLDARIELANQVVHDIRSPLTVIENIVSEGIRPETITLMALATERIQKISHQLLLANNETQKTSAPSNENLYAMTLDTLAIFKVQRAQRGMDIGFNVSSPKCAFCYVNVDRQLFMTVLNNLLDNAVESYEQAERVRIRVDIQMCNSNKVVFEIEDYGRGIADEVMGSIGQKGFSTKDYQVNQGGSGLGVYNAKRMLAGWSGFLEFAKKDGRGALVRITLPCSEAPNWIVGEIDSSRLSKVVIVDDDPKQLAFWTQKIQGELSRDMPIEIVYHQSIAEFMPMIPYYNQYRTSCLYIVDYDFAGERMNGLDLIIEQNLKSHAILCTDRDRDVRLQKSCIEASIQMLPKVLAPFSVWNPFNTTSTKFPVSTESSCRKIVLLDDDELIHILWRYWAEENKIDLTLFKKSGDLLSRLDTLSKDCHLYIDFHLGHENPNGAEIARILYDKGYRNLHICTGDELALGDSRDFVLSVRGKQPPSIF